MDQLTVCFVAGRADHRVGGAEAGKKLSQARARGHPRRRSLRAAPSGAQLWAWRGRSDARLGLRRARCSAGSGSHWSAIKALIAAAR